MSSSIERLLAENIKGSVDFALIAIREDEFEAVLHYFPPTKEAIGQHRTYEISDLESSDGSVYRAALLRSLEQGHSPAQSAASDVIADLNPNWIVLVGIAGAAPESEFSLGDVVIAERMIDFSVSAALADGTKEIVHRGAPAHKAIQDWISRLPVLKSRLGDWNQLSKLDVIMPPISIEDGLSHIPDEVWKDKLRHSLKHRFEPKKGNTPRLPIVTAAAIASGNILVKDPELLKYWQQIARNLKAVEMELPGVFEAARSIGGDKPVLAIRGISDVIGFKRDPAWTEFACKTAASLARALLDLISITNSKQQPDNIPKSILDKLPSELALITNGAIAEHHGEDAKTTLEMILMRRASPGQDTLAQMHELARFLDDGGKFAAAPPSIKTEVYDWIVRIAASNECLADAEHALIKLQELEQPASIAAQAWMEAARGEVDAALRMLRSVDSAAGRSNMFGILRTKKRDIDALAYLDTLECINPDSFTAIGWANVVGCLALNDRIEQATNVVSNLPDEMFLECTILGYFRGMLYVASSVPMDLRRRVIHEEFLAVSDHLLEGDDAENWRRKAYEAFEACSQVAKNTGDESLLERLKIWFRWLRIIDPVHKKEELAALSNDMNDGKTAVKLMPLAHAFGVKFDVSALTKHLRRTEMLGGLTPIELNVKVLLLQHLEQFPELASFIVDNWNRLLEVESLPILGGTLIQAYVQAGECGLAEEVLKAKQAELYPDDIPRFQLMIQQCRGEDPTKQAKDNYDTSGKIEDLSNLIISLEKVQRWTELTPYALEMFKRERSVANALRYVTCLRRTIAQDEDIVHFLDSCTDLVKKEPELMSAQAWALFHLGELEKSKEINSQLLNLRNNINDLSLDIYLTVRMGNWEKLPAILDREWDRRSELPVALLLDLARLVSSSARIRALQLVTECTERESDNPRSLLQAYSVAIAMAQDDIAMPLFNKARQLSNGEEHSFIKSLSTREIVEFVQDSTVGWHKKNELFRNGSIPIHWAAHIFNVPLSRLLIAIPRENKAQADARRRQPIPIRAGNRRSKKMSSVKRLALDVTSIFVLNELGFLENLFDALDEILLSPRFMEMLFFEEEKVRFHQPSRIKDARPLLELRRKGLRMLEQAEGYPDLVADVGEEEAVLLCAAKRSGGLYIHSGKLYRIDSYMEEEAELGDFSENLAGPVVVAHALCDEGFITEAKRDASLKYLELVSAGEMPGAMLAGAVPVFLDRVSAEYLSKTKLLEILINSDRKVFIHPAAFDEWQALVDTERYSEDMIEVLEKIRRVIQKRMAEGKVKFLREGEKSSDEEHFGVSALSLVDLLEDTSRIDAACIDDRMLNSKPILEDRSGRKVDLLCSLDVIDMLVEREVVTKTERIEAIHKMREWSFSTLPVDANELLEQLLEKKVGKTGILMESAKLRVIREYLARLHSSDFLCAASDLEYLDELWRIGQKVIWDLWKDEKSAVGDIAARADWVVDHIIPDIELALRFAPDGKERMEDIALARMVTALVSVEIASELKVSYAEWLERKIIAPYFPACSALIDKASRKIAAWAMACAKEIANETAKEIGEFGSGDADQDVTGDDNSQAPG